MAERVPAEKHWHRGLERNSLVFTVLVTVVILIGGLVEIVPLYMVELREEQTSVVAPYTPLQVVGRDIYVREGCYTCHSQQVRPLHAEVLRYGEWSRSAEYTWDRPFQLGSRRIGPDLGREGGLRTNAWHYEHFYDPRLVVPGSIMPAYKWLYRRHIDVEDARASVRTLRRLGTPYSDDEVDNIEVHLRSEADAIVADLARSGIEARWDEEVIALIAYMQRLGTDLPAILEAEGRGQEAADDASSEQAEGAPAEPGEASEHAPEEGEEEEQPDAPAVSDESAGASDNDQPNAEEAP